MPNGPPEVVVSGLPLTGDHPMHPFVIDAKGHIFIDLGSATNSCQAKTGCRIRPGHDPCTELETRGGTWRYDANKTGQHFSPAERYATGLRNGEGFCFDAAGRLFATQHGRDQLSQNWPKLYTPEQSAELPAEELVQLKQGRRLRLAGMLLRPAPEEARAGAGIWRRRRQEDRHLRREDSAGRRLSRAIGRRTIC